MNKEGQAEIIMLADNSSEYSMSAIGRKQTNTMNAVMSYVKYHSQLVG